MACLLEKSSLFLANCKTNSMPVEGFLFQKSDLMSWCRRIKFPLLWMASLANKYFKNHARRFGLFFSKSSSQIDSVSFLFFFLFLFKMYLQVAEMGSSRKTT